MCGSRSSPVQRRTQTQASSTPEPDYGYQLRVLRQKPLTAVEQEQRRSQAAAWEYSGGQGTNPYQYMPQSRLDRLGKEGPLIRTNWTKIPRTRRNG